MPGFDTFESRLIVTGQLVAVTPLRVGAGKSTSATGPDQPVVKNVFGDPVIPGSSLKGVLRSHLEALLRALAASPGQTKKLACDLLSEKGKDACVTEERIKEIKEQFRQKKITSERRDKYLLDESCWVCSLFGAPWLAGKFAVRDLTVLPEYWSGHYLIRDGVAIDRDTGTVSDKRKYDFEAVPAGTRFELLIQVDNASDAELGLALLALRALELEQVQVGGARSRGLGWCCLAGGAAYTLFERPIAYLLGESGTLLDSETRKAKMQVFIDAVKAGSHA